MNIAVIGTLDTKGSEVGFLREIIVKLGHTPVVIDPGILGQPTFQADVTRQEIAQAGGESLASLIARQDKAHAQAVMIQGLVNIVTRLYSESRLAGTVAVGGAQGTALATAAMRALPVGVPKVMLSTVACGKTPFGPYVGAKDICMMHSVADISGLNRVTYRLLAQAAHAVVAMASVPPVAESTQELVAITQAGITTPGVMAVKERLEQLGFEVIAFHCNGIGSPAIPFVLIHMLMVTILLPDRSPYPFLALGIGMLLLLSITEMTGLLPHYQVLPTMPQDQVYHPVFAGAQLICFSVTGFVIVLPVSS